MDGDAGPGPSVAETAINTISTAESRQQGLRSMLIVDDHAMIRRGFRNAIEEQLGKMHFKEVGSLEEARAALKSGDWNLVILDLNLQGGSGLELLEEFGGLDFTRFLVVTQYSDDEYAAKAIQLGACGYICKTASPDEMIGAVQKVLNGGKYITDDVVFLLVNEIKRKDPTDSTVPRHERLTTRELELLKMLAVGKSQKEIAHEINLSVKTVSTYHRNLLRKMRVQSDAVLAGYAIHYKLVTSDQIVSKIGAAA